MNSFQKQACTCLFNIECIGVNVMYLFSLMLLTYVAVFLFGMILMRIGFENLSKNQLQQVKPNQSIFVGLAIGFLFTLILQSSSVSIALLISFYAAYQLSIPFAICYIIGANIGTTLTAQLFIWNNEQLMIASLLLGFLFLFVRKRLYFLLGTILFGLGVIFSALGGLENLANQVPSSVYATLNNGQTNQPLGLFLFGVSVTSVIQSSTAFTGILMSFSSAGKIPLIDIYYLLLGANIGTCVTVLLMSLTHTTSVRIIAYIHLWVNVIGGMIFFHPLVGQALADLSVRFAADPKQAIVVLAFLYNLAVGVLFLLILKPFTRMIGAVHRVR